MITDEQEFTGAKTKFGRPIQTYDDGWGPLWFYRTASGLEGIVRTESWESAWEIVEDEILQPIPTNEVHEAYGFFTVCTNPFASAEKRGPYHVRHNDSPYSDLATFADEQRAIEFCHEQINARELDLAEGFSYQSNATGSGIVAHDLNGEFLELLTPDLVAELGLVLEITEEKQWII